MNEKPWWACPKCGGEDVHFNAHLLICAPMKYYSHLSKKAISTAEIQLNGVDWPNSWIWCKTCGWNTLKERESK